MNKKIVHRLVDILAGVFFVGVALNVVKAGLAVFEGSFGKVAWTASTTEPVSRSLGESGSFVQSHGLLIVEGQPFLELIELVASLALSALLIIAILSLRKLLYRIADGAVFDDVNIGLLRRMGRAMVAVAAVSVLVAIIMQPLILSAVGSVDGVALHPSLSWNSKGVENIWLEYTVPVMTFLLGAIALIAAQAFETGKAYREDSEGVL